MSRRLAAPLVPLLATLAVVACASRRPVPQAPLFPLTAAWKTLVGELVVPPLAADGRRVYVATRDGVVRALDRATGAVAWKAEGLPGRVSAADGLVLVRGEDGAVTSLQPRTGGVRWRAETGITGVLPAVLDGDLALVAGKGIAALDLATGRLLWSDASGADTTAPPVGSGARLFAGEADGTLRCRDRATGLSLWTLRTGGALLAPPLVDTRGGRLFLGTTDKRILEVSMDRGRPGWAWRVGADVGQAGLLLPDRVLFSSFDAVLYALRKGGNLAWRAALPSRPLSAPLLVPGQYVLVACLENEIVAVTADAGRAAGRLRTPVEIRAGPVLAGNLVVVGLRDRSVIAYALPGAEAPPAEAPAVEASPPGR